MRDGLSLFPLDPEPILAVNPALHLNAYLLSDHVVLYLDEAKFQNA